MTGPNGRLRTLLDLEPDALAREARYGEYPKWSTLCLIRSLGLPVLDAVLVRPETPIEQLVLAGAAASAAWGTDRILVRSDGGIDG